MSVVTDLHVIPDTDHRETDAGWLTRLGGKEYRIRCSCGLSVAHPQQGYARVAFFAAHEALIGGAE